MNSDSPDRCSTDAPSAPRWFVAQIKPNCATLAERNLTRQGFEVFAPFEELSVRHARQFKLVRRPLFPGYIFVRFDPASSPWHAINGTYGVSKLVTFSANTPAQVPPDLIEMILSRCDSAGRFLPPGTLKGGDRVCITSGPFSDFIATVERLAPQQRIWVLLDILGARTPVAVKAEDVRLAR